MHVRDELGQCRSTRHLLSEATCREGNKYIQGGVTVAEAWAGAVLETRG
jgi:hypothetical protein